MFIHQILRGVSNFVFHWTMLKCRNDLSHLLATFLVNETKCTKCSLCSYTSLTVIRGLIFSNVPKKERMIRGKMVRRGISNIVVLSILVKTEFTRKKSHFCC